MKHFYRPLEDAIQILTESEKPTLAEQKRIQAILEDVGSPVNSKYLEKLFDSIIEKGHINFGDIPNSRGDIEAYSGYNTMKDTLDSLQAVAKSEKNAQVQDYLATISEAILHMKSLAPIYKKGFNLKSEYVMLEYNMLVFTIVQAVSAILYEFVDFIKRPDQDRVAVVLRNTKYRADAFYFDQLNKFNKINQKMQYARYLEGMVNGDKNNFTGAEAIGLGFLISTALAILPVLRLLVYKFYNLKANVSDCLAQQAYFLEMNKTAVEANNTFNDKKKAQILAKQEKLKNLCLRMSEKLRINQVKADAVAKAQIQSDNKLLTIDTVKKEIDDSPLQLL